MLATISPSSTNLDETLATLRYACQARSIVNRARINENPHDRLIRELKLEVERLKALKKDYERNSIINNLSCTHIDESSNIEELDELRSRLLDAEDKLHTEESAWKKKFIESTKLQMKELAESEKRREELESKMRILKTVDINLDLSLYKTNFLEELQHVLTEEDHNLALSDKQIMDHIVQWCFENNLQCVFCSTMVTILDDFNQRQTFIFLNDLAKMNNFENCGDFINSLTWTDMKKKTKKITKSEIMSSLKQIYEALNILNPTDNNDNHLNLLYARVNKSLQSFEAALLTNLNKHNTKTVSFNV